MKSVLFFYSLFYCYSVAWAKPEKIDGSENLTKAMKVLLNEEQVLHNKKLWFENAFSSDIDPAYVPEARPKFKLPYYLIPAEHADFLRASTLNTAVESQIIVTRDGMKYYKMFVHPESEGHYQFLKNQNFLYVTAQKSEFTASPTSSYRSLVVWNESSAAAKPFIAKVSLDRNVIGSIDRLVSDKEVQRSIANQNAFDMIGHTKLGSIGVEIFPETAGLTIKTNRIPGAPEKLGGQLIREIPDAVVSGRKHWISFSALMSPERGGAPLIMDIIKKSGLSSEAFVQKYFIDGYMKSFEELSFKLGMNFEPHSQNLVMEFDDALRPTGRFVVRDFGGVWPDAVRMAENGMPHVAAYMSEGNATKFKFQGARGNYVDSYVNFYKRQVFDMTLKEIVKFDPTLNAEKVAQLKKNIDARFVKMIQTYFDPLVTTPPTVGNYKELSKHIVQKSKLKSTIPVVKMDARIAATFLYNKNALGERVTMSSVNRATDALEYRASKLGVYSLRGDTLVEFALFTKDEVAQISSRSSTEFFRDHAQIRGVNCLKGAAGNL